MDPILLLNSRPNRADPNLVIVQEPNREDPWIIFASEPDRWIHESNSIAPELKTRVDTRIQLNIPGTQN